jgi:hypothetical protein
MYKVCNNPNHHLGRKRKEDDMKERTGRLVLGRVTESSEEEEETFILLLIDTGGGRILESSRALTEAKVRDLLKNNYGEDEATIESRLHSARTYPVI